MRPSSIVISLLLGTIICSTTASAVPLEFVQQGRLLDASGAPLDGSNTLVFSIHDAPSGGATLWVEDLDLDLEDGYYATVLGAETPLDPSLFDSDELYLQLAVNGGAPLPVRQRLASVPFAIYAATAATAVTAENLNGGTIDASEIRIGGQLMLDASGNFFGIPANPLEGFSCNEGQILRFIGGDWGCDDDDALSTDDVLTIVETTRPLDLRAGSTVAGKALSTLTTDDVRADLKSSAVDLAASSTLAGTPLSTLTTGGVRADLGGSAVDLAASSTLAGTPLSTLTTGGVRTDLGGSAVSLAASSTVGGASISTLTTGDVRADLGGSAVGLAASSTVGGAPISTLTTAAVRADLASSSSANLGIGNPSPAVRLDVAGPIRFATTTATCDASIRGTMRYVAGGTNQPDVLAMCMKDQSNTYSWLTLQSAGANFPGSVLMTEQQQHQVNSWIGAPNQLWSLCYRKSTHGGTASTFHTNCNNRGPTVTVARLSTGVLIGGYAATSWNNTQSYQANSAHFLFSLTNNFKHAPPGASGTTARIYDNSSYGPTWGGGHDWHINNALNGGYCYIGYDYACRTGSLGSSTCQNDFCGNYSSWTIADLEVWYRN